jgi:citrate lyase subunit beta/citryl-CoA lyase
MIVQGFDLDAGRVNLLEDGVAMKPVPDKAIDLFAIRSILFLPASNPRAIAKARESAADRVVLDLEDAVKQADKGAARDAAVVAVAKDWPMPVAIRINSVGSEWHSLDLDAVARSNADFVVVPRAISAHLVHGVAEAVGKRALAMIETAAGVLAAADIAKETAALIAGTNDLRADLHLPLDATREPISASLQWIILAARASGIAAFDGVFNKLDDEAGLIAEAEHGRCLGFDGKSLIHPNQIAACNHAFAPTAAEIERARALVEAFQDGAERFGNEMVERMHFEAAQRVLARAAT